MRPQNASLRAASQPRCVMIKHRRNDESPIQYLRNRERVPKLHHLIVETGNLCMSGLQCLQRGRPKAAVDAPRGNTSTPFRNFAIKPRWMPTSSNANTAAAVHIQQMFNTRPTLLFPMQWLLLPYPPSFLLFIIAPLARPALLPYHVSLHELSLSLKELHVRSYCMCEEQC
jgi:hypothetical protein